MPRPTRFHVVLGLGLALVAACAGASCGGAQAHPDVPDALRRYERDHEVRPYGTVTIPGVELWQATPRHMCCDMESSILVFGLDAAGRLVSNLALVQRLAPMPAADLVAPVAELLLGRPFRAILPGDDFLTSDFVTEPERGTVMAPSLEEGVLTFFVVDGSMSPTLTRIRVALATGAIERTPTRSLVAAPSSP